MKLIASRGDVKSNAQHPLRVCAAGFPHQHLEYVAGGMTKRDGSTRLLYRCIVCGTVVEFTTHTEVPVGSL